MAINRVLYATQTARLHVATTAGGIASVPWILAVQTASADETIPQDDVLVLGKLGGAARLQKDVATSKASLKAFLVDNMAQQGAGSTYHGVIANLGASALNGVGSSTGASELLATLENQSLLGNACQLIVDSTTTGASGSADDDGFIMDGICSNISIDGSKGAFPSLDLSFEGVGRLRTLNMGTTGSLGNQHGGGISIKTVVPLTSRHVTVSGSSPDTVASVKFSYDMPTETLSALGGNIIGTHVAVSADNKMFSKPPFKASMNADGQGLAGVSSTWDTACHVDFKHHTPAYTNGMRVLIDANGLNISTRSFSQNVGDVGATYSVAAEGTDVSFYDI